jgi:hypothetical protein
MSDHRKPPVETRRRVEPAASLPDDPGSFSIETTTMRLKSLKLRRQESEVAELERATAKSKPQVKSVWGAPTREDSPRGRIVHDDRGRAVFDLAIATGEFATLSATNVMEKLDIADLKIEETARTLKAPVPKGREMGGGSDPYNQRTSGSGPADKTKALVLDQLLGKKR